MMATLEQLAGAFNVVSAQVQQLQTAMHTQAASQPAPRPTLPKIANALTFRGTGAPSLEDFRRNLLMHFAWYGLQQEEVKVRYAAMQLQGAALDWWYSIGEPAATTSADDFFKLLAARFSPIDIAVTARTKLDSLVQGPKQSMHEYIMAFRALVAHLPQMHEDDKLHRFLRGVHSRIATQLRVQGVTTLDEAINMAARISQIGDLSASGFGSRAAGGGGGSAPMELDALNALAEDGAEDDPEAEVRLTRRELGELLAAVRVHRGDASKYHRGGNGGRPPQRELPKIPHLTEAQVRMRMANKQCFGCGSTEHMSRKCSTRHVAADGTVTWNNPN